MSEHQQSNHQELQPSQAMTWAEAEKPILSKGSHREYGYPVLLLLKKPGLFLPEKRQLFHTKGRDQPERTFMLVTSLSGTNDPARFAKPGEQHTQSQRLVPTIVEREIELSREILERIEAQIRMLSMPLRVGKLAWGWLDGTEHEIWIHNWDGECQFSWYVEAPKEWHSLESLFHEVWELGPLDYGPFVRNTTRMNDQ